MSQVHSPQHHRRSMARVTLRCRPTPCRPCFAGPCCSSPSWLPPPRRDCPSRHLQQPVPNNSWHSALPPPTARSSARHPTGLFPLPTWPNGSQRFLAEQRPAPSTAADQTPTSSPLPRPFQVGTLAWEIHRVGEVARWGYTLASAPRRPVLVTESIDEVNVRENARGAISTSAGVSTMPCQPRSSRRSPSSG